MKSNAIGLPAMHAVLLLILTAPVVIFAEELTKFYFVPGATSSCMPSHKTETIRINRHSLKMTRNVAFSRKSDVLVFPGCFDIEFEMEILDLPHNQNLVILESFEWLNALPGTDLEKFDFGCQGADRYGCGGVGNRCYYCDACKSISEKAHHSHYQRNDQPITSLVDFQCPKQRGVYHFKEHRCFNDWGKLDKNKDGKPDFLDDPKFAGYKEFLNQLNIVGYGSVRLSVFIAGNATRPQQLRMDKHKDQLYLKLRSRGFSSRSLENQWAKVYKDYWLPKLVTENIMSCVNIYFDMCKYFEIPASSLRNFRCK